MQWSVPISLIHWFSSSFSTEPRPLNDICHSLTSKTLTRDVSSVVSSHAFDTQFVVNAVSANYHSDVQAFFPLHRYNPYHPLTFKRLQTKISIPESWLSSAQCNGLFLLTRPLPPSSPGFKSKDNTGKVWENVCAGRINLVWSSTPGMWNRGHTFA